jgi:hypothetical protein
MFMPACKHRYSVYGSHKPQYLPIIYSPAKKPNFRSSRAVL